MNFPDSVAYLLPFLLFPLVVQIPFGLVFTRLGIVGKVIAVLLLFVLNVYITYIGYGAPNFDGRVLMIRVFADVIFTGFLFGRAFL
ncbi:hypothetical protein [Niabella hibiscisoli]|uniref:hypothetical protein n=1 Tax=Niabella hibiscisoli TaxID=1825928 RepID=UPI001F0DEE85|nr:hypothetical protein [Niabella hibiscisoli]MCH5721263.1 hypothetical protein [Niabella hibiscisoli]